MNFREHFEAWHQAKYGYVSKHKGTAWHVVYATATMQARWEAWQACASWHTGQEIAKQVEQRNA